MNASISSLTQPIMDFFGRYHATIFITFISLSLSAAIFVLLQVVFNATDTSTLAPQSTIKSTFDEVTAKQIQELRESNEVAAPLQFPNTRTNPFIE